MSKAYRCLRGGRILIGNNPTNHPLDTPDVGSAFNVVDLDCPFIVNEAFVTSVPAGDTLDIEYIVEQSDDQAGPFTVVPEYDNCPETCPVVDNTAEDAAAIGANRLTVILPVKCVTKEWARLVMTYRSALGTSVLQTNRMILVGESKVAGVKTPFTGEDIL